MKSIALIILLAFLAFAIFSVWQRQQMAMSQIIPLAQDKPVVALPPGPDSARTSAMPLRGPAAPDVTSATWLNSRPLSPSDLRGKVVLVDFWTFDCINCRNTLPQLEGWYQKYHDQGLVIIGVHSPEFDYEHDVANVKQAIQDLKIPYAVALDNDFKTWNAYRVYAWPTWFIVDKQGAIRYSHVGEGAYAESEQTIAALLKE